MRISGHCPAVEHTGHSADHAGGVTDDSPCAVRSYGLYIGGTDRAGAGWVYTVSSRSLLEDVFTSLRLKRVLEQDADPDAAHHPYVVGRCAVAGDADIDASIEAAAAAASVWADVPLAERMRVGPLFRDALLRHQSTFLDLLVAE